LGRFVLPGRHGLIRVVMRDLKLLPRILIGRVPGRVGVAKILLRDVELRWAMLASLIGAYAGYFAGRSYEMNAYDATADMRWLLSIGGAIALMLLAMAIDVMHRTAPTRRLGIHA
jgi:hypothetical protein